MFKIYLCNITIVLEKQCEGLPDDEVQWRTLIINVMNIHTTKEKNDARLYEGCSESNLRLFQATDVGAGESSRMRSSVT
jgi:hypothetical protein